MIRDALEETKTLSQAHRDRDHSSLQVLHIDRNSYYGGESASLQLTQLWEKFKPSTPLPPSLGPNRDYNIDLVPKFMMANGKLVKVLVHTG